MIDRLPAIPMNGLSGAEYFDVPCDRIGDTFRVFVAKPLALQPGKTYPVIYVLDGNLMFSAVREIHYAMALAGELSPAFIVGLGYAADDYASIFAKRDRDYSPTDGGDHGPFTESEARARFGGAANFLDFLETELKPEIAKAYPVDPDDSTLVGSSFGGLFASWLLMTRPDAFRRYVLCSPSIWWHDEMIWQWEDRYAADRDDLEASVFVTAGGFETIEKTKEYMQEIFRTNAPAKERAEKTYARFEQHGWPRMAEITPEFTAKLQSRRYPGLDICCHTMPDETHMSVWPGGISRGLRYVFGAWKP